MKVLILGNKGMLGRDMETVFHDQDFIGMDKEDLNILDGEKVLETFVTVQPDVVINCTGYTNVDGAESDEEMANRINGYAVGVLARASREIEARFVHFSTDYVFDGLNRRGYNEEDATHPLNAYGRSKVLGENLLFDEMEMMDEFSESEGKYFLIRTSWLYGKHGKNFVDTMIRMGWEEGEVKVVDDQISHPTYTLDLCNQVKWLISTHDYPSGIYHVTNDGEASWFDFAKEVFLLTGAAGSVVACSSEEMPREADRPKFSALNNNKLPPLRNWKDALQDYIK